MPFLLSLLCFLVACATTGRNTTPLAAQVPGDGERVLSSASGSFSAVFPDKGWQVVERLPQAMKVEPGDRPLSITVLADYLAPEEEHAPISDLIKALISRQLADKSEWHIIEQGEAWLGGRPAVRLQASATVGQNPILIVVVGRQEGARLYSVELTGIPSMMAIGLSAFDRVADTFRWTPSPGDEPRPNASAAELAAEADRSVHDLDPSRAVALLMRAVELSPGDGALSEKLVRAEMLTGDVARALRTLKTDVSRNPDHFEHWRLLASLQMQQGDQAAAIATLKTAAARPGAPAALLASLGEAYLHGGDLKAAEQTFQTAIARDAKNAELRAALGEVYLRAQNFDAAEATLKLAVTLDPSRGDYHAALSEVYGHRNQDQLAARECMEALERGVGKGLEATLKYNLACFHARLGHKRECLYWLRQAFEAGFNDVEFMRKDPDLASVRDLPEFRELFEGAEQPEN